MPLSQVISLDCFIVPSYFQKALTLKSAGTGRLGFAGSFFTGFAFLFSFSSNFASGLASGFDARIIQQRL